MKTTGKIYISSALMEKLEIPPQPAVQVRAGNIVATAKLAVKTSSRKTYLLSPKLANTLFIRKHKRLQIRYDKERNMLHLGPIIGILTNFLPNKEEFSPKSLQAELIFLSNIGKTLPAQVFVFTPQSINWSNSTVKGHVYRQISADKGIWVSSTYPLPDVVYDRISNRSSESKKFNASTKKKLMNLPYTEYFNPFFLNKWKVYQMLTAEPKLLPHLPETRQLNVENLAEMLSKYKTLYLKPANGSMGRGIIKIRHSKNSALHYTVYKTRKIRGRADNVNEFWKKTKTYRKNKQYIVQQGIDFATYNGCNFDIRIIYQKNARGEWQISKKFVRVAPRGSSISNLSSGGRVEKNIKVFRRLYKKQGLIEEINAQIKELCRTVALTLEKNSQAVFGELGLDIGMDEKGSPWLIEVNSKPRKTTETEFSQTIVRNTFKRPLQYAIHLAGFSN
ncbi:MAG: YheC/YheD family protein [Syntrophomonadaceae bacterium]|nr:YheC/YheD family protein [Syntrophomonadaceae bacterium]